MVNSNSKKKEIKIKLDTTEMTDAQIRLVKSMGHLLESVLTTDDESEYFESSAQLLKVVATAIKKANFGSELIAGDESIEYTKQALEYSIDLLTEDLDQESFISYDN